MIGRRTGLLVALAAAGGLALGTVGTSIAAGPQPTAAPWTRMMGGSGMMSGFGAASGSSMMSGFGSGFGPSMMSGPAASLLPEMMPGLTRAQRDAMLQACEEVHHAIRGRVHAFLTRPRG